MKKMVLVLTLAAFALSGSAFAQDPNYFNNIGLYLTPGGYVDPGAEDGTGSCGVIPEDVSFTAFVVLSRLTNPEVWGWEASFTPDNMLSLGGAFYGEGLNIGEGGEFIVALNEPLLAVDGAVAVAELSYVVNSYFNDITQPSYAFINGVYFSTIDPVGGPPAVLVAPSPDAVVIELHNAIGDPFNGDLPQLIMNGDCDVVGVEDSSWGSVKSLFR